jgi:hypothetical protein
MILAVGVLEEFQRSGRVLRPSIYHLDVFVDLILPFGAIASCYQRFR